MAHYNCRRDAVLARVLDLDDFYDLELAINWFMSKCFMQCGVSERKDLVCIKVGFATYKMQGPLYGLPCIKKRFLQLLNVWYELFN
jgi:hypothetical protein